MKTSFSNSTAWFDRFSPIPGLFLTSCVCCTLLALQLNGFRGSEDNLAWIRANRTWVSIAVQVMSHLLGLIYIQVLCAVLRTSFVLSLIGKTFPIYLAQFIQAASTPRMTWALPWKFCLPLILIVATSLLPAALWAGAVTPLASERNTTRTIDIPSFHVNNISTLWTGNSNTSVSGAAQWMTDKGLFSFDPSSVRGPLLASAAQASSFTYNTSQHAKLDRTGYRFLNRSFGTGAVAGFTSFSNITSPGWYHFQEIGFSSQISCRYNDTIADVFGLGVVDDGSSTWGGLIIQAAGFDALRNSKHWTTYYIITMQDSFAWLPQFDGSTKTIAIQMITAANETHDDWAFRQFNNIQCELSYTADIFDVFVNTTSQTILSSPTNNKTVAWPSHGDAVISKLSSWLWAFTYSDGCIGGCQIGRSLRLNANLLQNSTEDYSNVTILRATEDYFGSLTDNILINLILTRMVGGASQSTTQVDALVNVPAVVFGDQTIIVVLVVLNTLICTVYTWELIRTRAWKGLPTFDLSNICDVILSATKGGMLAARLDAKSLDGSAGQRRAPKTSPQTCSHENLLTDVTRVHMRYEPLSHDLPALVPLFDNLHGIPELVDTANSSIHSRKPQYADSCPLLDR